MEQLTSNFRTGAPVLAWVNHTFDQLIAEEPGFQPAYVGLHPVRPCPPSGPAVAFVGLEPHPRAWRADHLREAEASDVAAAVREAMGESWSVYDEGASEWRPARWDDIAVLLPARTSLPMLERALERAGVPYRAETSSLVYGTGEVRDLLMIARAVEDPDRAGLARQVHRRPTPRACTRLRALRRSSSTAIGRFCVGSFS